MTHTVKLSEWLNGRNVVELLNSPVEKQLSMFDSVNTGVGFVFVLTPIAAASNEEHISHFDLTPVPVVKIKGEWLTLLDENLADILAGVVRMVAPSRE